MGTPRYLAPEALAGAAPDPRMDVFSVGVVLGRDGGRAAGRAPRAAAAAPLERIVASATAPIPRSAMRAPRKWRAISSA